MSSRKALFILIACIAALGIGGAVFFMRVSRQQKAPAQSTAAVVRAQYTKGSASFLYPAQWVKNDIPTSPGFISVQLLDRENIIVFVAASGEKESDSQVDGALKKDDAITVGGISGKERVWENEKTQAVVLRADHIVFGGRAYRFEMFGQLSRKVLMEKQWQEILSSVQFAKTEKEAIHAAPATSSASTKKK